MRSFSIILLVLFVSFGFTKLKTKVKISPKSEVIIKGKSNVNSFQCKYDSSFLNNEIAVTSFQNNNKTSFEGAKIAIKSKGFECAPKMITKDLKTTLKAIEYPTIDIELNELVINKTDYIANITVQIAGKSKQYSLQVVFNPKNYNVSGQLKINIKDFDLKPPKKMLGLVEVNENVVIDFNLYLQY